MKKSLLTESEIRKFMKFANIETLSENFINNSTTLEEEVVEEATEELEVCLRRRRANGRNCC